MWFHYSQNSRADTRRHRQRLMTSTDKEQHTSSFVLFQMGLIDLTVCTCKAQVSFLLNTTCHLLLPVPDLKTSHRIYVNICVFMYVCLLHWPCSLFSLCYALEKPSQLGVHLHPAGRWHTAHLPPHARPGGEAVPAGLSHLWGSLNAAFWGAGVPREARIIVWGRQKN